MLRKLAPSCGVERGTDVVVGARAKHPVEIRNDESKTGEKARRVVLDQSGGKCDPADPCGAIALPGDSSEPFRGRRRAPRRRPRRSRPRRDREGSGNGYAGRSAEE
jgi:hypothetical protein